MKEKVKLRLSASQISLFKRCKRAWYYRYVEKIKVPPKPWLRTGVNFHECIEKMYKKINGESIDLGIYPSDIVDMVNTGFKNEIFYIPKTFSVEPPIKFDIMEDVSMIGFIDFLDVSNGKIVDHKTIKSFQWALSEDDLREDLQLNIYGYWYLSKLPKKNKVTFRHNQIHKIDPELSTFKEVTVSREEVMTYFKNNVLPFAKEIYELRQNPVLEKFPCNISKCGDYGGCDYENVCVKI